MLIKEHSNGYFYLHFYDGTRSRVLSLRTKDSTEAHRQAHLRLAEVDEVRERAVTPTVGRLLDYYFQHKASNTASHATIRRSINHLKDLFENLVPQQLTPGMLRSYRIRRNKAQGTIRKELGVLRAALNYAVKKHIIKPDQVLAIDVPPMAKPRDKWATLEQLDHLQATAERIRIGDRLSRAELFLHIAIETGARKSAIQELRWQDVDFNGMLIDFTASAKQQHGTKKRSIVPISDRLLEPLRRAYDERQNEMVLGHAGDIRGALKRVTQAAELDWITPHVLRHSFASNAAMAGVPLLEISRVLGNGIAVVERTYSKHTPGYLRGAVNWRSRPAPGETPSNSWSGNRSIAT